MKIGIDRQKLFEADCKLLQQKLAVQRQAMCRHRTVGNFIPWEPFRR